VKQGQAAEALDEFFKDNLITFDLLVGWTRHDYNTGDARALSDDELDSLLYLVDIYINGE
jgi:hypothetical protein